MKIKGGDVYVLEVATAIFIVSVYLIFDDHLLFPPTLTSALSRLSVGLLRAPLRDVRRKAEDELSWTTVARDEDVYDRDRVFTGDKSQASLNFDDHSELTINSNSLVIIEKQQDTNKVNLSRGTINGLLGKKSIIVSSGIKRQATLRGENAKVLVKLHEGLPDLVVYDGSVEVTSLSGETQIVRANQELAIEEKKTEVKTFGLSGLKPESGARLDTGEDVLFKWDGDYQDRKAVLEISPDVDFRYEVTRITSSAHEAKHKFEKEGGYFWRVQVQSEGWESSVSQFQMTTKTIAPRNQHEIIEEKFAPNAMGMIFDPQNRSCLLQWDPTPSAEGYFLEISKTKDFKELVIYRQIFENKFEWVPRVHGHYYWRIRALMRTDEKTDFSTPFEFNSNGDDS